jgi:hypothetical protein
VRCCCNVTNLLTPSPPGAFIRHLCRGRSHLLLGLQNTVTLPVKSPEHAAVHEDWLTQLAGQEGMLGFARGSEAHTAGPR